MPRTFYEFGDLSPLSSDPLQQLSNVDERRFKGPPSRRSDLAEEDRTSTSIRSRENGDADALLVTARSRNNVRRIHFRGNFLRVITERTRKYVFGNVRDFRAGQRRAFLK